MSDFVSFFQTNIASCRSKNFRKSKLAYYRLRLSKITVNSEDDTLRMEFKLY